MRDAPIGLLEEIVEARAYMRAKALYESAKTPEQRKALPRTDLVNMVQTITFDLVREAQAARQAQTVAVGA